MIKVAPSILAADMLNLERDVQRMADAGCDLLHVDVMDAHFVPNLSYGPAVVKQLHRRFPDMKLDVHLMMDNPEKYVQVFAEAGAWNITIHAEIPGDAAALLREIRALGIRAGLSLKPGTPAEAVEKLLPLTDMVLVMTVEPGFGGQSFMADMMPKVSALRRLIDERNPVCELEVDGGVAPETCQICIDAGANVLVAGSAVYKAADIPARIAELRGAV